MRRKEGFASRKIGDSIVLVPAGARVLDMNGLVTMNATGLYIWELLDGTHSLEEIAAKVADSFEVDPEQATTDVREFVAQLHGIGLLQDEPAAV
jgi:hypothetical protein